MNCLPERTYAIYVDGELPPDALHEVETHLIQCQRCRGLILVLEEEAAKDESFREILESQRAFRANYAHWKSRAYLPRDF